MEYLSNLIPIAALGAIYWSSLQFGRNPNYKGVAPLHLLLTFGIIAISSIALYYIVKDGIGPTPEETTTNAKLGSLGIGAIVIVGAITAGQAWKIGKKQRTA